MLFVPPSMPFMDPVPEAEAVAMDSPADAITDLSLVSISKKNNRSDRNSITLSWSAPNDNGSPIVFYHVQVHSISGSGWVTLENNVYGTTYTHDNGDQGVATGYQYSYRVFAIASDGCNGNTSNFVDNCNESNILHVVSLPDAASGTPTSQCNNSALADCGYFPPEYYGVNLSFESLNISSSGGSTATFPGDTIQITPTVKWEYGEGSGITQSNLDYTAGLGWPIVHGHVVFPDGSSGNFGGAGGGNQFAGGWTQNYWAMDALSTQSGTITLNTWNVDANTNQNPGADPGTYWGDPWPVGEYTVTLTVDSNLSATPPGPAGAGAFSETNESDNVITGTFTVAAADTPPPTSASGVFTITDGTDGGDCTSIGTWNSGSKTCDVTADITGGITVGSDGITIDGHSKSITRDATIVGGVFIAGVGDDGQNMLYIGEKSDVAIKNLHFIGGGVHSMEIIYSDNVSITQITATGIRLVGNNDVVIKDNVLTSELGFYKISSSDGNSNILVENNILDHYPHNGIVLQSEGSGISFINNNMAGLSIANTFGVTVSGNTFNGNADTQLTVKSTTGGGWDIAAGGYVITDNTFLGDGTGTGLRLSTDSSTVTGNTFSNFDKAICLAYVSNFTECSIDPWIENNFSGNVFSNVNYEFYPEESSADTTPPVITLPSSQTYTTNNATEIGLGGTNYSYGSATATDDYGSATISCSPLSGSFFTFGTTTVTCTATDAAGNPATGTFTVTVVLEGAAEPSAPTTLTATAYLNATSPTGRTISLSDSDIDSFIEYYGDTTFGITASKDGISLGWDIDDYALTWQVWTWLCGDNTRILGDDLGYNWGDSQAVGNCQLPIPEHWEAGTYDLNWVRGWLTQGAGETLGTGSITVTVPALPATDATPPSQNYTVEITIGDYDPNWSTPNQVPCAPQTCYTPVEITINVGDSVTWVNNNPSQWYILKGNFGGIEPWYSGNYVGTSGYSGGDGGCDAPGHLGYDMCGVSGYDITSWTHTFDQVGTYQYHDYAKQNYPQRPEGVVNVVASGASPPVTDNIPPVFPTLPNVSLSATNSTGYVYNYTLPTATDNVSIPAVACTPPHFDYVFPLGVTTVTCTATDAAGNPATGTFTVTVVLEGAAEPSAPTTLTATAYLNATSPTGRTISVSDSDIDSFIEYYGNTAFGITASKDGISLGWDLDNYALTWWFNSWHCRVNTVIHEWQTDNCQLPIPEHWEAGTYDLNWARVDGPYDWSQTYGTGSTTVTVPALPAAEPSAPTTLTATAYLNSTSPTGRTISLSDSDIDSFIEYYGDTTFGITASKDGISLGWDLDDYALTWQVWTWLCGDNTRILGDGQLAVGNCQLPIPEHWEAGTYDLNWVRGWLWGGAGETLGTGSTTVTVPALSTTDTTPAPPAAINDLALQGISKYNNQSDRNSITLTWSAPSDNGWPISQYVVQAMGTSGNWITQDNNVQGTTYTHEPTATGIQFSYRVWALNEACPNVGDAGCNESNILWVVSQRNAVYGTPILQCVNQDLDDCDYFTDTVPPVFATSTGDITVQTTDQAGKTISYATPYATDNGIQSFVSCDPPSGSTFQTGTTAVTCTAVDAAGNEAVAIFKIIVIYALDDTTAPVFASVSNVSYPTTDPDGAIISYATPSAHDNIAVYGDVVCDPPSGDLFPVGNTIVTCTASDAALNTATTTFTVTVINTTVCALIDEECDTDAPVFEVVDDLLPVEADAANGMQVPFSIPTATDDGVMLPHDRVFCTPSSGFFFPVGDTTVVCSAFDDAGNQGTTSFTVTVLPNTQPQPGQVTGEIYNMTSTGVDSVTLEGDSASSISAGSTGYFSTSISSEAPQNALVAIYVQGADGTPLGMTALKYVVGMTESELRMGLSIPGDAASGTANVYVNVLTDWPELSGMDLMDGESIDSSVQINGLNLGDVSTFYYNVMGFPISANAVDGFSEEQIVNAAISYWKNPDNIDDFAAFNRWSEDCPQCVGFDVNSYADSKVPLGDDFVTDLTFNQVDYNSANLQIHWVKDYGGNIGGMAPISGLPKGGFGPGDVQAIYISLGSSAFSGDGSWQPYTADHLAFIVAHELGHVIGFAHDGNPDSIMYSSDGGAGLHDTLAAGEFGTVELTKEIAGGDSWSIPAFTSRDKTNFNYHVSTDNEGGVNAYFVPNLTTAEAQHEGSQQIDSYPGCLVEDIMSTGVQSCNDVEKGSGLFITVPLTDETEGVLSEITVKLQENFDGEQTISNVASSQEAPIIPTSTLSSKFELLEVSEIESEHESVFLDGTNFLEIPDEQLAQDIVEFSVVGWIVPDFSKGSQQQTIVSKYESFKLFLEKEYFQLQDGKTSIVPSTLNFSVYDGAEWYTVLGNTEVSEDWHHVAAVVDDSVVTLYLDGKIEGKVKLEKEVPLGFSSEAGKCQQESCIVDVKMSISDVNLAIGAYVTKTFDRICCDDDGFMKTVVSPTAINKFPGGIYDPIKYSDALSGKQIAELYRQEKDHVEDFVAAETESPTLSDSECLDLAKERGLEALAQVTRTLVCQFPFDVVIPLNSSILWMETLPSSGGPYHMMRSVDNLFATTSASFALMDFNEPEFTYGVYEYVDDLNKSLTGKIVIAKNLEHIDSRVTSVTGYSPIEVINVSRDSAGPDCEINNSCYEPFAISIDVREEVTWKNIDSFSHSVTSGTPEDGPDGVFNSGLIPPMRYFSHTFSQAGAEDYSSWRGEGIYDYYCTFHPWMKGIVVVGEI